MIVLPMLLTVAMSFVFAFVFFGVTSFRPEPFRQEKAARLDPIEALRYE